MYTLEREKLETRKQSDNDIEECERRWTWKRLGPEINQQERGDASELCDHRHRHSRSYSTPRLDCCRHTKGPSHPPLSSLPQPSPPLPCPPLSLYSLQKETRLPWGMVPAAGWYRELSIQHTFLSLLLEDLVIHFLFQYALFLRIMITEGSS